MALLQDRVVLVTGGSRNVGAGIVRSLAEHGATVAINYIKNADRAAEVAEQVAAYGSESSLWQCDVTDSEAVTRMVDGIVEKHGRIDGVVDNATSSLGTEAGGWYVHDANWEHVSARMECQIRSLYNLSRASLPHFRSQGEGRFVSILSEQWTLAPSAPWANAAAKGTVVGILRRLAFDHAPENITFNIVSPGWTHSERNHGLVTPDHEYVRETPMHRIAEPEDIGNACVYFISKLGSFVTGNHILVNGGRSTHIGL